MGASSSSASVTPVNSTTDNDILSQVEITKMNRSLIKATAPLVASRAEDITKIFYKTMFENNPEAQQFFNVANQKEGRQAAALANIIIAYAYRLRSNDNLEAFDEAVELIMSKHCGMQILPEHYHIVQDNLMIAIANTLGAEFTLRSPKRGSKP